MKSVGSSGIDAAVGPNGETDGIQLSFAWRARHQYQKLSVSALKQVGDFISYVWAFSISHALSDGRWRKSV